MRRDDSKASGAGGAFGGAFRPGSGGSPGSGAGAARPDGRPGSAPADPRRPAFGSHGGAPPPTPGHGVPGSGASGLLPETSIAATAIHEMRRPAAMAPTPVEAPAPSLPKGGGSVQPIAEKFSMNPATGTGGTSIGIGTPSGRSGFGPSLAAGYDSGAGNGPWGLGWALSVPSISRKTDKGIPRYFDYKESDTFVLSGAEDLVPYLVEGAAGWERKIVSGTLTRARYRPRVEGDFSRIYRVVDAATKDAYWEVTTPDNVTHIYGRTAQARIADPSDGRRIFQWLLEESRDDRGNVILYQYKAEDLDGVPRTLSEMHRHRHFNKSGSHLFANRYLKRIWYGNKSGVVEPSTASDFHYEVIFDYGEHDAALPSPSETVSWPVRQDPFSRYRAGFEIRTYRLCRRVLVFHRFAALDGGAPTLVRSTNFSYDEGPLVTYLSAAQGLGYTKTGASYDSEALPKATFSYSQAVLESKVRALDEKSTGRLPYGVDGRLYQWIDMDGEGLPGILTQQGGGLYYKRNLGGGKLAGPERLKSQPSSARLGLSPRPGQRLLDVTGDGLPDVVDLGGPSRGYHARTTDGDWAPQRRFSSLPTGDYSDPSVRFVDLSGDGLADVMMSDGPSWYSWFPSLREEGFGPPRFSTRYADERKGPHVLFQEPEQTVFLADMTGDGLADLVQVRNGRVVYWPNLGWGKFGAQVVMGGALKMAPSNLFSPSRIRLADVDGSGPADLLYLGSDGVHVWQNQAGNSFSAPEKLAVFPGHDGLSNLDVIDLFGTGTACLVWSSPLPAKPPTVRYVDLLGGQKPHLLVRSENGIGLETRVRYTTSTLQYLEDRKEGIAWATRLPFPVQIVDRVEHYDHIEKHRFVSTYRYRHGYYDAEEREFRGFGFVEQRDADSASGHLGKGLFPDDLVTENGELVQPPAVTKSWFHTGTDKDRAELFSAYEAEWYDPGAEPRLSRPTLEQRDDLSPVALRQAYRALAGALLRQEVYAEDRDAPGKLVRLYTVSQQTHSVRREQPAGDSPYAVFFRSASESLSIAYDRELGAAPTHAPRVTHELALEVDGFGHPTKTAAIAYEHPGPAEPEQTMAHLTATEHVLHHNTPDLGPHRHGVPVEEKGWQLGPAAEPSQTLWTKSEALGALGFAAFAYDGDTSGAFGAYKRLLSHGRTLYLQDDGSVGGLGQVGGRALVHQGYAMALTDAMRSAVLGLTHPDVVAQACGYRTFDEQTGTDNTHSSSAGPYWAATGSQSYDQSAFYLVTGVTDAFGNTTTVGYDADKLFATSLTDPLSNTVSAAIDYRVGAPRQINDINGNFSGVAFDPLGRVIKSWRSGKNGEGDSESAPTARFSYELGRYQPAIEGVQRSIPARIKSEHRETHADAQTRWLVAYTYLGGAGQTVMTKSLAEPGEAVLLDESGHPVLDQNGAPQLAHADPRFVATGRTVRDNKNNPVKQYEPYFSATEEYEDDPDVVQMGVTAVMAYDPLGRLERVDYPDGTHSRVTRSPWREVLHDQNDTVSSGGTHPWYQARLAGDAQDVATALKALAHADTPTRTHHDALGRPFLIVEHNLTPAGAEYRQTRAALDVQGNVLSATDAHGRTCMRYTHGMLGQVLKLESLDAGSRWRFDAGNGQTLARWGERGAAPAEPYTQRVEYDALRRPTAVWLGDAGTEKRVQKLTYGEAHPSAGPNNLRGRLVAHYDQSGVVTTDRFDFKGNLEHKIQRLAADYEHLLDWSASPALESEAFSQSYAFDALDRPTRVTLPDGTEVVAGYNVAGLLASVSAHLRGAAAATPFVDSIAYDEKGRRTTIAYADESGDHVRTEYSYDPRTFRLKTLVTKRLVGGSEKRLQDLRYSFDPVGNITYVKDAPDHGVYFSAITVPSADGDYTYDALYRLIEAKGREHATGSPVQLDEEGAPIHAIPHPNDPSGLRRYTQSFVYDVVDNLLSLQHDAGAPGSWTRTYGYSAGSNRLATTSHGSLGTRSYTHDAHGNMATMPHLAALDFDFADQLKHVEVTTGQHVHFTYDASGARVRKIWLHGSYEDHTLYLGGYEVFRRYVGGVVQDERQTVHISDDARRICMVETETVSGAAPVAAPTPRFRFQLDDHLGSVGVEVDQHGSVISYEQYHPYGTSAYRAWDGTLGVSAKRYRYNGKERDEATGLYYYGARYYAPWLGRWTAADPLWGADGPNLYAYVRGSPIVLSDPNGMESSLYLGHGDRTRLDETWGAGNVYWKDTDNSSTTGWYVDYHEGKVADPDRESKAFLGAQEHRAAANEPRTERQKYLEGTHPESGIPAPPNPQEPVEALGAESFGEALAPSDDNSYQPSTASGFYLGEASSEDSYQPRTASELSLTGQPDPTGVYMLGAFVGMLALAGIVYAGTAIAGSATTAEVTAATTTVGAAAQSPQGQRVVQQAPAVVSQLGPRVAPIVARGLGGLSRAGEFGIKPYRQLRGALRGTGLQAHHLIEQRFARLFGTTRAEGLSVAVTRAEHQVFTNRWRELIPYRTGTQGATRESVEGAAREVYRGYPEILRALGL